MTDDKTLEEKIGELVDEEDDAIREILEDMLALIRRLEIEIKEPPIKQGKK